ncbi:hypothetical protein HHI36_001048 [Cryptolaemus montrouzieri]|uniref:Uncharacterized protein n=1 Tax=Cryptolaemus montrouzieri TaxID=559131 RepID=A0ABD2P6D5_9CUCU
MTFANEDHLNFHQKKHAMSFNLELSAKNSETAIIGDQTPTPTSFFRNCEEVGLFQDLQNVNPFEETFKKALENTSSNDDPKLGTLSIVSNEDTLHTPNVFPTVKESSDQCVSVNNDSISSELSIENILLPQKNQTIAVVDSTSSNIKINDKQENLRKKLREALLKRDKLNHIPNIEACLPINVDNSSLMILGGTKGSNNIVNIDGKNSSNDNSSNSSFKTGRKLYKENGELRRENNQLRQNIIYLCEVIRELGGIEEQHILNNVAIRVLSENKDNPHIMTDTEAPKKLPVLAPAIEVPVVRTIPEPPKPLVYNLIPVQVVNSSPLMMRQKNYSKNLLDSFSLTINGKLEELETSIGAKLNKIESDISEKFKAYENRVNELKAQNAQLRYEFERLDKKQRKNNLIHDVHLNSESSGDEMASIIKNKVQVNISSEDIRDSFKLGNRDKGPILVEFKLKESGIFISPDLSLTDNSSQNYCTVIDPVEPGNSNTSENRGRKPPARVVTRSAFNNNIVDMSALESYMNDRRPMILKNGVCDEISECDEELQETFGIDNPNLINFNGFSAIYNEGNINKNGGTVIFIKDKYNYQYSVVELDGIRVIRLIINRVESYRIQILALYRSPTLNVAGFVVSLEPVLYNSSGLFSISILLGDSNIDILDIGDDQGQEYLNIFFLEWIYVGYKYPYKSTRESLVMY